MNPRSTPPDTASISARIDRIPSFTPRMRGLIALLAGLFAFEFIDLQSFGLVAPALQELWGLEYAQLGVLTSTLFVGMIVGGLLGGPLADRIGRRPVVLVAVTLFSLTSLASAFAPSPEILGVLRLLTGVGLSAATGSILVLVSEYFPKALRGRAMAIVFAVATLGLPVTAVIARASLPAGDWQAVFLFGSLGVLIVVPSLWLLPESPRWLAARGRDDLADAAVRAFEDDYRRRHTAPLPAPIDLDDAEAVSPSVRELFRPRYLGRTVIATLLFAVLVVLNYGLSSWFPVILTARGYPAAEVYGFLVVMAFGGMAGALGASLVIDRMERKWLIVACAATMAVCYLLIGFIDAIPILLTAGLTATIVGAVLSAVMFTYAPEIFPIELRGAGTGFANGVSRVMGVFNAVVIGFVLSLFDTEGVFVYLTIAAGLILLLALAGPRVGVRDAQRARAAALATRRGTSASAG